MSDPTSDPPCLRVGVVNERLNFIYSYHISCRRSAEHFETSLCNFQAQNLSD